MSESAVQIEVDGEQLQGILHEPKTAAATAVICLHGWSGSRIGPHRIFVETARKLAAQGARVLRFDFRGRGDSTGDAATTTIPGMVEDALRAIDWMSQREGVERILLLGICSGGKVAVSAAARDPRVAGLVLWSAEPLGALHGEGAEARKAMDALKTYARKLGDLSTWKKIVTGRVQTDLVRKALVDHEAPSDEEIEAENGALAAFADYAGPVLFIYGGGDPATAVAAANYATFCTENGIAASFHEIPEANHSFYSLTWKAEVLALSTRWIRERMDSE